MLSSTEENYLKAIFKLSEHTKDSISTNAIATSMSTSAASVTDMLKRLTEKQYTLYEKYKGVRLSDSGRKIATMLIRKHRLWETFMVDKLHFSWDEVHPIAEQLEHIQAPELVNRLEEFLGFPKFDPHGDPIPDRDGNLVYRKRILYSEIELNLDVVVIGVDEHSSSFLRYINQLGVELGTRLRALERFDFDHSIRTLVGDKELILTNKVCQNLYVQPL